MDIDIPKMDLYKKDVETDRLLPGDIVAQDIYLKSGALVIKAGAVLNDKTIDRLKNMGPRLVTIDLTQVYMDAVEDSKMLMKKAAEGKPVTSEMVESMVQPIMREVRRERNISRLLIQLQSQDDYTFQHTINIGVISMVIAQWIGYKDTDELTRIAMAGTLHDIGKSKIPKEILKKPNSLTAKEFETMKKHPYLGYRILNKTGTYDESIELAVLQHHERDDGKGYPDGLVGNKIHPYAKIIAVADVYHAMTSERVYKDKIDPFAVLDYLLNNIGNLDARIVLTFIDSMLNCLLGCRVVLNNGSTGRIIFVERDFIACPLVKLDNSSTILNLREHRDMRIDEIIEI